MFANVFDMDLQFKAKYYRASQFITWIRTWIRAGEDFKATAAASCHLKVPSTTSVLSTGSLVASGTEY